MIKRLTGIIVGAAVKHVLSTPRILGNKLLFLKMTDEILDFAGTLIAHHKHPARFIRAAHRQFKQVGAFPHAVMHALQLPEIAVIGPLLQIFAGVEFHMVIHRQRHQKTLLVLQPDNLGIAEILAAGIGQHTFKIAGEAAAIRAVSNGLLLYAVITVCTSVSKDKRKVLMTRRLKL